MSLWCSPGRTGAVLFLLLELFPSAASTQDVRATSAFSIARLKYSGGGDWYNGPTEEPNLLTFVHQQTGIDVDAR